MNILVIGSGGREHALCYALQKSPTTDKIYCLPGNAGTLELAECAEIELKDFSPIAEFCKSRKIALVVVGPEGPLVEGIADFLEGKGIAVFGPSKAAAQLEGSKNFTKNLCVKYNIPTAFYQSFTDVKEAIKFIETTDKRLVVKADGLAAGKGVIIPETKAEAIEAVHEIMGGKFGAAGKCIVIEEFLEGEEASFFALSDGKTAIKFGSAQDHKRAFDGDKGLNTGGMGTYSPAPIMTEDMDARVMREIIIPTIDAMRKEGTPFKGVLFAGLMITKDGPKLIEFNARFGDPETQVLMLRLESDLAELLLAAATGKLAGKEVKLADSAAVCVVMAAKGYPGEYQRGSEIQGLEIAAKEPGAVIFHAGTKKFGDKILADGGRVLGIAASGKNVAEAREIAYRAIAKINWPEGFYRSDIGAKVIKN